MRPYTAYSTSWLLCVICLCGFDAAAQPGIAWSSYLGGSDQDHCESVAVDGDGNILVTGTTYSAGWVSGGWDATRDGQRDAFVAKLTSSGVHAWSSYLGGDGSDYGYGIAVDSEGNILVAGYTLSSAWVSGGWDTIYGGNNRSDGFVVKLAPWGGHVWSSYLGGNIGDHGYGVAVDSSGNVLVTGLTVSSDWVSGGWDTEHDGSLSTDGFVVKLTSTGDHVWSSYLGGGGPDEGYAITSDSADNILVTGETGSPHWVSGGWDTTRGNRRDGFVVKLAASGGHVWSSFLGGMGLDAATGIATDASGNILVTGQTGSAHWISGGWDTTFNGDYGEGEGEIHCSEGEGEWCVGPCFPGEGECRYDSDGFVVKLTSSGEHVWSSYLGGNHDDDGLGIAV
ncbi:MAG: hypothetical protein GY842_01900, partial [bacterium]|nr:hypothetical protein [bacterium]